MLKSGNQLKKINRVIFTLIQYEYYFNGNFNTFGRINDI